MAGTGIHYNDFKKLADYVNGLRNALYERIETLVRDVSTLNRTFTEYANLSNDDTEQLYKSTATLREENAELRERVAMLETRMRETQNILRTVKEALVLVLWDFIRSCKKI